MRRDARLDAAAEAKLTDIIEKGYFAHISQDKGPVTWIRNEGYPVLPKVGENFARHFDTVQEMVAAWEASPTHRANIVEEKFVSTGIAVSGPFVVQMFGAW
ncbi:CAP domain-containing protein [Sphingosinicella sp. CPCC 101087]|uniref:CAP domain-containing protein n=1 Tax=Sphingosinicella sp. CPCC 101087 TaxID=2497754 RepID=UPI00352A19E2